MLNIIYIIFTDILLTPYIDSTVKFWVRFVVARSSAHVFRNGMNHHRHYDHFWSYAYNSGR